MDSIVLAGDIWTGGMETTLTATRWAIIFFMANPEIQETLHREIVAVSILSTTAMPLINFSPHHSYSLPHVSVAILSSCLVNNLLLQRYPRRSNGKFDWTSRREELPYLCATLDEILRLANVLPWNIPHRYVFFYQQFLQILTTMFLIWKLDDIFLL